MSDDSARWEPSPASPSDEISRLAVAAHSLLGGVAAVRREVRAAMYQPQEPKIDSLLVLAAQRLDRMAEELRDLALGLPGAADIVDLRTTSPCRTELRAGTRVEVHSSFNDVWTVGFEVAETVIGGYRVRRVSDHSLLPGLVASSDVRVMSHPSSW